MVEGLNLTQWMNLSQPERTGSAPMLPLLCLCPAFPRFRFGCLACLAKEPIGWNSNSIRPSGNRIRPRKNAIQFEQLFELETDTADCSLVLGSRSRGSRIYSWLYTHRRRAAGIYTSTTVSFASSQLPGAQSSHEAGLLRISFNRLKSLATLVLNMQLTFLFALLPLLAGIAQADNSELGLDIRVVKENSKRGSDDGVVRRAGESVVNSYTQCEQVCVSLMSADIRGGLTLESN